MACRYCAAREEHTLADCEDAATLLASDPSARRLLADLRRRREESRLLHDLVGPIECRE